MQLAFMPPPRRGPQGWRAPSVMAVAGPRFESVRPLFFRHEVGPEIVLHREPFAASHVLNTCLYLGFGAVLADREEVEIQ